jgi:hypothetical protein
LGVIEPTLHDGEALYLTKSSLKQGTQHANEDIGRSGGGGGLSYTLTSLPSNYKGPDIHQEHSNLSSMMATSGDKKGVTMEAWFCPLNPAAEEGANMTIPINKKYSMFNFDQSAPDGSKKWKLNVYAVKEVDASGGGGGGGGNYSSSSSSSGLSIHFAATMNGNTVDLVFPSASLNM